MNAYKKDVDEKEYENVLNESWGSVTIGGQEFDAGTAYQELDPTGF